MRSTLPKLKTFWGINPWFPLLWAQIHPAWLSFGVLTQLKNAFSDKLSGFGFNFFLMLVIDLLHEFELGVWKAIIIHLLHMLDSLKNGKLHELNQRCVCFHVCCTSRSMDIINFQISPGTFIWKRHYLTIFKKFVRNEENGSSWLQRSSPGESTYHMTVSLLLNGCTVRSSSLWEFTTRAPQLSRTWAPSSSLLLAWSCQITTPHWWNTWNNGWRHLLSRKCTTQICNWYMCCVLYARAQTRGSGLSSSEDTGPFVCHINLHQLYHCMPAKNIEPPYLQTPCTWWLHGFDQDVWVHRLLLDSTSEYTLFRCIFFWSQLICRGNGNTELAKWGLHIWAARSTFVNWLRLNGVRQEFAKFARPWKPLWYLKKLFLTYWTSTTISENHNIYPLTSIALFGRTWTTQLSR